MNTYPEHEKLALIKDKSQAVGEFLEWTNDQGYHLAEWDDSRQFDHRMMPILQTIQDLLSTYFDIDQNRLEAEKLQMLEEIRQ